MTADIYQDYLVKQAAMVLLQIDENGFITTQNKYATRVFGHIVGTPFQSLLVHPVPWEQVSVRTGEVMLSVTTRWHTPATFLFTFVSRDLGKIAFGQMDIDGIFNMQSTVSALNGQMATLTRELSQKNAQLQHALDHVKQLQGMISICMHCNKIRNEKQMWQRFESYIESHSDAVFSHGICDACLETHYGPDDDEDDLS